MLELPVDPVLLLGVESLFLGTLGLTKELKADNTNKRDRVCQQCVYKYRLNSPMLHPSAVKKNGPIEINSAEVIKRYRLWCHTHSRFTSQCSLAVTYYDIFVNLAINWFRMKVNVTTSKRHVSIKEETKYSTRLLSGWRLFFGGQNVSSLSTKQKLQTNCESCVCPHSSATLLVAIGSLCCFRLWSSTTRFFDVDSNPLYTLYLPSLPCAIERAKPQQKRGYATTLKQWTCSGASTCNVTMHITI